MLQILILFFTRAYVCLKKTWVKSLLSYQYQIIAIFRTQIIKKAIRGEKKNSKIVAIHNKYKNTLDNLINSLDPESSDWLELINKELHNWPRSKNGLIRFLDKYCLNANILTLNRLSRLALKTKDS